MAKKIANKKPINAPLGSSGVMRLSRGRMFHKRGLWLLEQFKKKQQAKKTKQTEKRMVEKPIKGEKNGGKRLVRVSRFPRSYPTQTRPKKLPTNKKPFKAHKHKLRQTLVPGTVCILVAGRHAGKVSLIFF